MYSTNKYFTIRKLSAQSLKLKIGDGSMDPVFASVVLGFFTVTVALVAVAIAIAYRQNDVAREAVRNSSKLSKPDDATRPEKADIQENP
jgi:hypothetical protein